MSNWEEFYSELYNESKQFDFDFSRYPIPPKVDAEDLKELNKKIAVDEVILAINTFKDYRSSGADMILNRDLTVLLMPAEDNTFKWDIFYFIEKMLNQFWEKETVPVQFKESIIRPFLKPGKNPRKRKNYRPVSLLNVFMKLYELIIKERLVKFLEKNFFFLISRLHIERIDQQ